MGDLEVDSIVEGRAVIVRAQGEVDSSTVAALTSRLTAALEEAATSQVRLVVVDLRGVTFFGSAGLNALLDCHKQGSAAGTPVRVVADTAEVVRPIEVTHLDSELKVYPGIPEALHQRDPKKAS